MPERSDQLEAQDNGGLASYAEGPDFGRKAGEYAWRKAGYPLIEYFERDVIEEIRDRKTSPINRLLCGWTYLSKIAIFGKRSSPIAERILIRALLALALQQEVSMKYCNKSAQVQQGDKERADAIDVPRDPLIKITPSQPPSSSSQTPPLKTF